MTAAGKKMKNIAVWLLTVAVCLSGWAVTDALAADDSGLVVEQVYLREILRNYSADPAGFDGENSAQALAELFTATVGLNYYGEGNPASYFAKDITAKYEQAPYIPANLLASYDVPIHPVNGRAEATGGQTWKIHVYLTGYNAESVGAVPVYHYVWQDNGSWWAVRDDVPYYRVSYKGMGAAAAANAGLQLCWSRSGDVSQASNSGWANLTAENTAAVANGSAATYVAVQGQSAIFSVKDSAGNTLAISDYVRGSSNAGPVLRSKTVIRADGSTLAAGEEMIPGETYRVRMVYRDGLKSAQRGTAASVTAATAEGKPWGTVTDVVWYGADEYLTRDDYNPETVEFTVTAADGGDWCLFSLHGVVGFESGLSPAAFWQNVYYVPAPTAQPVVAAAEPVQTPTVAPVITQAPVVTAEPAPAVVPEPVAVAEPRAHPGSADLCPRRAGHLG